MTTIAATINNSQTAPNIKTEKELNDDILKISMTILRKLSNVFWILNSKLLTCLGEGAVGVGVAGLIRMLFHARPYSNLISPTSIPPRAGHYLAPAVGPRKA